VENRQGTLRIGYPAVVGLKLLGYGSTAQPSLRREREGPIMKIGWKKFVVFCFVVFSFQFDVIRRNIGRCSFFQKDVTKRE
jgi:hypothetical protein